MYVGNLTTVPLAHRQTTHSVIILVISAHLLTCVHKNAKINK